MDTITKLLQNIKVKQVLFSLAFAFIGVSKVLAAVTVTVPSLTINTCSIYPTSYNALGNIVITENAKGDFAVGSPLTLILTAPANFQFLADSGSTAISAGGNLSIDSTVVTSTTITVYYNCVNTNKFDVMTISGIMVRGITGTSSANATRTGGSGTISGLIAGTAVASLTSANVITPVGGSAVSSVTNPVCNNTATTLSLSGSTDATSYQWQSSNDDITFSDIVGATSSTYIYTPAATSNKYFRCILTCTGSANSASVLVTSQACDCTLGCTATAYDVNLSASPENTYTLSDKRNGDCCSGTNCIRFNVIVSPLADEVSFDVQRPSPSGSAYYQVDCGPSTSIGTPLCINGVTTFCITYCKPGGDSPDYIISSSRKVNGSPDITLRPGCSKIMTISGLNEAGITWKSVSPGAIGDYNSYLSCIAGCDTTTVTAPASGAPASVKYVSSGTAAGCTSGTSTDTVTVTFVSELAPSIAPANPAICFGSLGVGLTGSAMGGVLPYTYSWNTGETTSVIVAAAAGTYTLSVSDATGCPPVTTTVTVVAHSGPITADAGADQSVCSSSPAVTLAGIISQATGGTWSGGSGTYVPDANTLNATYTPSAAELLAGTVTLTLTSTGNGGCTGDDDVMIITINQTPTASAGGDQTICSDASASLAGTIGGGASGGTWTSSGTGTFDDANSLTAVYSPSAADILGGTITLTLTSTGNGACAAASDAMVLTINPVATASAGADATICSGSTYILSGSRGGSAASSTWTSSGTGTFDNAALVAATYTPSAADITAGTVTLTITTNDPAGPCPAASDAMVLTINPVATASAGADATICSGSTYVLSGSRGGGATSSTWTSSGTGTFDDASIVGATYAPSAADITAGTVTLTITTNDPVGPCPAASDAMVLTINPVATASAGADATICSGSTYTLSGSRGGSAASSTWTSSGTGTFDDASIVGATYTPSAADITAGTVTLTIT
ncbi:MAG: hypothetical protein HYU69_13270, partial [Bacteroidetes bacterium]|nr:hypothetical protein [Bacteroidota bacterium]